MPEVFEYLDYRKYLKDYFEESKKKWPHFSYRYFGKKIGMPASNLVKTLQHERHISQRTMENVVNYMTFTKKEEKYFRTMVGFCKAKREGEAKQLLEDLCSIKSVDSVQLHMDQYEFYRKWYHTAICGYLYYTDFKGDFTDLAGQLTPSITPTQARESVELLKSLKVVALNSKGYLKPTSEIITTAEKWKSIAISEFQKESIQLALHSLENHPVESRDISTLSVTVSKKELNEMTRLASEFRTSILNLAKLAEIQIWFIK